MRDKETIGRGEEIAMLPSFTKQLVSRGKHVPLNTELDILPQGAPEGAQALTGPVTNRISQMVKISVLFGREKLVGGQQFNLFMSDILAWIRISMSGSSKL